MTLPIAFVDCETTHLDASIGHAWEVAIILREFENGRHTDTEYVWQIRPNLATADPEALRIGRFEERFAVPAGAEAAWTADESGHVAPMTRAEAVTAIVNVLRGAIMVGSNPAFDDRHLRRLVGRGRAQWHYRPYDIVQLAAAKLGVQAAGPLPWPTHAMSRAVGVEPPSKEAAHTALGDARWARDVHDAAMIKEQVPLTWEGRAQHAIGLYTRTAIELEDATRYKQDYLNACGTIAAMHAAATGRTGLAPIRGVVEDVADVRAHALATETAVAELAQAIRLTREYIGEEQLPAIEGWSWFDALRRHAPHELAPAAPADGSSEPVMTGETTTVSRTERSYWVDIANALNAAIDAGMPVGIDLDGTLTDHAAWHVVWDSKTERWTVTGYDDETPCTCTVAGRCEQCADDDQDEDDEEFEETGDADGDVFELISEIASRLSDATDEGEYHAVNLIGDLANGRKTLAEAREELAEITFRHV